MAHRKCRICGQEVVLLPSAEERARKSGQSAQYYLDLFPDHANCLVERRSAESRELAKRISGRNPTHVIIDEISLEQRLRHARAH